MTEYTERYVNGQKFCDYIIWLVTNKELSGFSQDAESVTLKFVFKYCDVAYCINREYFDKNIRPKIKL